MKFESSVDINAPIDMVVALFNNPENFMSGKTAL
jgi:carbon monoxide dehydrogenase subunit G